MWHSVNRAPGDQCLMHLTHAGLAQHQLPLPEFVPLQTETLLHVTAAQTASSTSWGIFHTCPVEGPYSLPLWLFSMRMWELGFTGPELTKTSSWHPLMLELGWHRHSLGQTPFYTQDVSLRDTAVPLSIHPRTLDEGSPSMCRAPRKLRDKVWAQSPLLHPEVHRALTPSSLVNHV